MKVERQEVPKLAEAAQRLGYRQAFRKILGPDEDRAFSFLYALRQPDQALETSRNTGDKQLERYAAWGLLGLITHPEKILQETGVTHEEISKTNQSYYCRPETSYRIGKEAGDEELVKEARKLLAREKNALEIVEEFKDMELLRLVGFHIFYENPEKAYGIAVQISCPELAEKTRARFAETKPEEAYAAAAKLGDKTLMSLAGKHLIERIGWLAFGARETHSADRTEFSAAHLYEKAHAAQDWETKQAAKKMIKDEMILLRAMIRAGEREEARKRAWQMLKEGSSQNAYSLALDLEDEGLKYEAGKKIGLYPEGNEAELRKKAEELTVNGEYKGPIELAIRLGDKELVRQAGWRVAESGTSHDGRTPDYGMAYCAGIVIGDEKLTEKALEKMLWNPRKALEMGKMLFDEKLVRKALEKVAELTGARAEVLEEIYK